MFLARLLGYRDTQTKHLRDQVDSLLPQLHLRAKSVIVTIYGDSVLPHGGSIWLGSLIDLVTPLGLSERVVRTAVFRLSRDEWLDSQQIGRRSYYSISDKGRRRFESAHKRIYAPPQRHWTGTWDLAITGCGDLDSERRERLRKELVWLGFGQVAPGVFAHPSEDTGALANLLLDLGASDQVVVMKATADRTRNAPALHSLVRSCWDIEELARNYLGFLHHFRPIWRTVRSATGLDPALSFVVRTLLIHDYRRVLLRDPLLPDEVLPANWPGAAARLLCRNLYRVIYEPAERHIMATLETADGPLPGASPEFRARFGGLDTAEQEAPIGEAV